MPRELTLAARQSLTAQETDQVWLLLLTITAVGLTEPIRVVNDRQDVTSRGNLHVAYPFECDLPGDSGETVQRVTLRIDNVDRGIISAIRAVREPPAVTLEVIRRAAPDTVEAGPFVMSLVEARADAFAVEGELVYEDVLNAPFPAHTYNPADYPGLF